MGQSLGCRPCCPSACVEAPTPHGTPPTDSPTLHVPPPPPRSPTGSQTGARDTGGPACSTWRPGSGALPLGTAQTRHPHLAVTRLLGARGLPQRAPGAGTWLRAALPRCVRRPMTSHQHRRSAARADGLDCPHPMLQRSSRWGLFACLVPYMSSLLWRACVDGFLRCTQHVSSCRSCAAGCSVPVREDNPHSKQVLQSDTMLHVSGCDAVCDTSALPLCAHCLKHLAV